jgi:hypothetical protein
LLSTRFGQRAEVDRLTKQVGRCRTVIDSILSLAEQLKQGTIEKVLAKSDLELGLEFLLFRNSPHSGVVSGLDAK